MKISPDLSPEALEDVLSVALAQKIDGVIVSNTSVARPPTLLSSSAEENGGLSGRPIFSLSTQMVAACYRRCGDALPIIGVGGVEDAKGALAKIEAGARLVQIYTGLIYRGPGLVREILNGLSKEADRLSLASLSERVGVRAAELADLNE